MGHMEFYKAKDTQIWDEFRVGNSNAFEIIYERNIKILANYGKRICSDDEMVKDAIQDLFIDLWRSKANLQTTESIKFYLIKAYRRNLIKKIVASKKLETHDDTHGAYNGQFELSHEISIIEAELVEEMLGQLNSSLNGLPSRQKEALFLRFYTGLNYTEISRIMEVNQQSAYNMVFRALEVLREKMAYALSGLLLALLSI